MTMTDVKNLLVELFVEELPPKALKKLGEAFATGLATACKAAGPGAGRCGGDAVCVAAAAGGACHRRGGQGGRPGSVQQKLMPVAVAWTPTASPRPRC
jgi:glycyl-tRNA synthetase beta chain